MLACLEINGFRTFEGMALQLTSFTVIPGSNVAGKSNSVDVACLRSSLATRDVTATVRELQGEPLELFRQLPGDRRRQIAIAAEVLIDSVVRDPWGSETTLTHTRMRYQVTLQRREVKAGVERILVARKA